MTERPDNFLMPVWFEIEWCQDGVRGRDVLRLCLSVLHNYIVPDGCHVYTPDVLDLATDDTCEASLWFSVLMTDEWHYRSCVDALRAAGWRVKTAGTLGVDEVDAGLSTCDARRFFDWLYRGGL